MRLIERKEKKRPPVSWIRSYCTSILLVRAGAHVVRLELALAVNGYMVAEKLNDAKSSLNSVGSGSGQAE